MTGFPPDGSDTGSDTSRQETRRFLYPILSSFSDQIHSGWSLQCANVLLVLVSFAAFLVSVQAAEESKHVVITFRV